MTTGDHNVCRNLARIVAAVGETWMDIPKDESQLYLAVGALNILLKAASHPHIDICGLAVPLLTRMAARSESFALDLLSLVQRRAITPHHQINGMISLDAADTCGVSFLEFQHFRNDVLHDCIIACWRTDGVYFMNSCTSAVEEFCAHPTGMDISLQLEAALFCIEMVAAHAFVGHEHFPYMDQLQRCMQALAGKSRGAKVNSLGLARISSFLRVVSFNCVWAVVVASVLNMFIL
jgi:hypothetical protein